MTIPTENKTATGPVLWAAHYKEYKEHDKREKRGGNALSGSSLGGMTPTAYDIDTMDTSEITKRQQLKREIAQELGIDSENWRVAEVMRRRDHDDQPYPHTHERQMESHKINFHLTQAHGALVGVEVDWSGESMHRLLHLSMARDQDPGHLDRETSDWHDSIDVDL